MFGAPRRMPLRTAAAVLAALAVVTGFTRASHATPKNPDSRRTPGATSAKVSQEAIGATICNEQFLLVAPKVRRAAKRHVFVQYGITDRQQSRFFIDLLVPFELGGTTALKNLWPQSRADRQAKDRVEQLLRALVCSHQVDLAFAQRAISENWRDAEPIAQNAAATRATVIGEYLAAVEAAERARMLAEFIESLPPPPTQPDPPVAANPEPEHRPVTPLRPDLRPSCDTEGAVDRFGNVCRPGPDGRLYWYWPGAAA